MPWDGTGEFVAIGAPDYPAVAGEVIYADRFNAVINDLIEGLNNCVTRDYQEGDFWLDYTDPLKGAALMGYGVDVAYAINTVGDALNTLFEAEKDLLGTASQITVTETDAETLTLSLPSSVVFPGTARSVGVTNAGAPTAGQVGEYLEATSGAPVSLAVSGDSYDAVTLALTAGDYLVGGTISFDPDASFAFNFLNASISLTSVTPATFPNSIALPGTNAALGATVAAADYGFAMPLRRVNVSGATTMYLVAKANFSAGTCAVQGKLWAHRIR